MLHETPQTKGKRFGKYEEGIPKNLIAKMEPKNSGTQEYDAVLARLNKVHSKSSTGAKNVTPSESIEELSQKLKHRIHYKKFLRGKDVHQYSDKDMNSIFVTSNKLTNQVSDSVNLNGTRIPSFSTRPYKRENLNEEMPTSESQFSSADCFSTEKERRKVIISNSETRSEIENLHLRNCFPSESSCANKKRKRLTSYQKEKKRKLVLLEGGSRGEGEPKDVDSVLVENDMTLKEKAEQSSSDNQPNTLQNVKSCLKNALTISLRKAVSFSNQSFRRDIDEDFKIRDSKPKLKNSKRTSSPFWRYGYLKKGMQTDENVSTLIALETIESNCNLSNTVDESTVHKLEAVNSTTDEVPLDKRKKKGLCEQKEDHIVVELTEDEVTVNKRKKKEDSDLKVVFKADLIEGEAQLHKVKKKETSKQKEAHEGIALTADEVSLNIGKNKKAPKIVDLTAEDVSSDKTEKEELREKKETVKVDSTTEKAPLNKVKKKESHKVVDLTAEEVPSEKELKELRDEKEVSKVVIIAEVLLNKIEKKEANEQKGTHKVVDLTVGEEPSDKRKNTEAPNVVDLNAKVPSDKGKEKKLREKKEATTVDLTTRRVQLNKVKRQEASELKVAPIVDLTAGKVPLNKEKKKEAHEQKEAQKVSAFFADDVLSVKGKREEASEVVDLSVEEVSSDKGDESELRKKKEIEVDLTTRKVSLNKVKMKEASELKVGSIVDLTIGDVPLNKVRMKEASEKKKTQNALVEVSLSEGKKKAHKVMDLTAEEVPSDQVKEKDLRKKDTFTVDLTTGEVPLNKVKKKEAREEEKTQKVLVLPVGEVPVGKGKRKGATKVVDLSTVEVPLDQREEKETTAEVDLVKCKVSFDKVASEEQIESPKVIELTTGAVSLDNGKSEKREVSSSHFDSWRDSQRIAMKMKIYKRMKSMLNEHSVLASTNMWNLKGYGNWGF